MEKSLPIFSLTIDENIDSELEVSYVALVDNPAIEKNFIAFTEHKPLKLSFNDDKRIISGPAMLADTPIYRKDEEIGEYYVVFSPEVIYTIAQKFFKKGFNNNFNLFHDASMPLDGVTVFESFIVDKERGIYPMRGFEDAKVGSWFISSKVDNDKAWSKIKNGDVKGYSVEGMFKYKKQKMQSECAYEKAFYDIKEILNYTK